MIEALQAENERLRVRLDFYARANLELGRQRAEMCAENERLHAALAVFANEDGWWQGSPEGTLPGAWVTVGDTMRKPWTFAQEALTPKETPE